MASREGPPIQEALHLPLQAVGQFSGPATPLNVLAYKQEPWPSPDWSPSQMPSSAINLDPPSPLLQG